MFLSLSLISFTEIPIMHGNSKYIWMEGLRRRTKLNSRQHGFQIHKYRYIKEVFKISLRRIL